jgi:hypothetical protein
MSPHPKVFQKIPLSGFKNNDLKKLGRGKKMK